MPLSLQENSANNSTCYWASDMVQDKDAPDFPYFIYFLVAYSAIKFFRVYILFRQLKRYKETEMEPYVSDLFK